MHLLGICVLLVFLLFTNLASDFSRSDDYYYDYYYEQERTDEPVGVSTSWIGSVRRTRQPLGSLWGSSHQKRIFKYDIKKTASPRWGERGFMAQRAPRDQIP